MRSLICALALAACGKHADIPSASMMPTLEIGDVIRERPTSGIMSSAGVPP